MKTSLPRIKLHTNLLDSARLSRLTERAQLRFLQLLILADVYRTGDLFAREDQPLTLQRIAWRMNTDEQQLSADLREISEAGLMDMLEFDSTQDSAQVFNADKNMSARTADVHVQAVSSLDTDTEEEKEEEREEDTYTDSDGGQKQAVCVDFPPSFFLKPFSETFNYQPNRWERGELAALEAQYSQEALEQRLKWADGSQIPPARAPSARRGCRAVPDPRPAAPRLEKRALLQV
ncbi:MAG: hypothetical protein JXB15_16770 [Anaerolineales bacterium]|nr:hypothetical protein [Anaerolineales bacterium]